MYLSMTGERQCLLTLLTKSTVYSQHLCNDYNATEDDTGRLPQHKWGDAISDMTKIIILYCINGNKYPVVYNECKLMDHHRKCNFPLVLYFPLLCLRKFEGQILSVCLYQTCESLDFVFTYSVHSLIRANCMLSYDISVLWCLINTKIYGCH